MIGIRDLRNAFFVITTALFLCRGTLAAEPVAAPSQNVTSAVAEPVQVQQPAHLAEPLQAPHSEPLAEPLQAVQPGSAVENPQSSQIAKASEAAETAREASGNDARQLLEKYQAITPKLQKNQYNAPIYLESIQSSGTLRADMYGVLNYPFSRVSETLQSPANWCDITSLHLNIKACTSTKKADQWLVTLYSGRKFYEKPSKAYPLKFAFHLVSQQPDYLDVSLTAEEGPLGTRDHKIKLQAVPIDSGKTFVHFSYTYGYGTVAKMATRSYFNTIGHDKVGFSTVRREGKTEYATGVLGALERNTVRYYLAVQAYMDALKYPEAQRFEQRISRWYDLTAKYPRQLKEQEKGEYLAGKRRERVNQVLLQKKENR